MADVRPLGQLKLNIESCSTPHATQKSWITQEPDAESACGDVSILVLVYRTERRLCPLTRYMCDMDTKLFFL
jgi:hypothetical protein